MEIFLFSYVENDIMKSILIPLKYIDSNISNEIEILVNYSKNNENIIYRKHKKFHIYEPKFDINENIKLILTKWCILAQFSNTMIKQLYYPKIEPLFYKKSYKIHGISKNNYAVHTFNYLKRMKRINNENINIVAAVLYIYEFK